MANEESNESKYQSRFGGNWITASQHIAEIICERLAGKNKIELPCKFWNLPRYKRMFMTNILAANSLLKMYHPKAIIAALRKSPNLYSLRAPWLDDLIKEEQQKLDNFIAKAEQAPSSPSPAETVKVDEKPRPSFTNTNSLLKKLRGLDG